MKTDRSGLRLDIAILTLVAGIFLSAPAQAGKNGNVAAAGYANQLGSASKTVFVHVVDQDLGEFIREAARRNGYEVSLSKKVRGRIQQMSLPVDIKAIMTTLSPQFNLKWHYQQNHIFVSTGQENATRLVYLGAMDMNELENAMATAGITSETFEMSYVEESNSVLINGSASFIAGIELLADAYNKNAANRKSNVRVIRFGRVGS